MNIEMKPIGWVRSSIKDAVDDVWGGTVAAIELDPRQFTADSLAGLSDFSHVEVLFHFDQVAPERIHTGKRHPRGRKDFPATGIFAQRGRERPNRIGLSTCRIVSVEDTRLRVAELDAIDGTPVLDIKPYVREFGPRGEVKQAAWSRVLMSTYFSGSERAASRPFRIEEGVEILRDTPRVLDALLRGKSDSWLHCRKTPDAFSAIDVLGHLILSEQNNWLPRVRMILEFQDSKSFVPFDRFAFQSIIGGKSVAGLLEEFASLREKNLKALPAIEGKLDWRGMHPELGPVTLGQLLATWAVHDLGHISQIVKTMAGEYRATAGPWREYLTILD